MNTARKLPKGFDAADAVDYGITAATIHQHLRIVTPPLTVNIPEYPAIAKACGISEHKPTRSLIPGVQPVFDAGVAIAAHDASQKLKKTIGEFLAKVDAAIIHNQEVENQQGAREKAREKLYSKWLEEHPEHEKELPPEDVRGRLNYKLRKTYRVSKPIEVPRMQIKGEAGIGKSTSLLDALATGTWNCRHIDYHVPTINLAEELANNARVRGIQVQVIEGRKAENCVKSIAAKEAGSAGLNVMESLCIERLSKTDFGLLPVFGIQVSRNRYLCVYETTIAG